MINGNGGLGATRVLPHIDDLVNTNSSLHLDNHAPLTKLLQTAEDYAKQADTHFDFRRPDLALEEYIKAFNITVEDIPRHKDFPSLQAKSAPASTQQLWTRLQKRINAQHAKFEQVKTAIKVDNAKTGVTPRSQNIKLNNVHINGSNSALDLQLSPTNRHDNQLDGIDGAHESVSKSKQLSPARKLPPPVQRKPTLLHGKALHQKTLSRDSTGTEDLASRFARLRGYEPPSPAPVQDPQIRTRPIVPLADSSRASLDSSNTQNVNRVGDGLHGPRPMPRAAQKASLPQNLSLDLNTGTVPVMPRAPDAVYSPARGFENPSDSSLRHKASRNSLHAPSRTNSVGSLTSGLRASTSVDEHTDYFSLSSSAPNPPAPTSGLSISRSDSPKIPDSSTVSATDLYTYLGMGSQARPFRTLLVDIRNRSSFDEGHIMARSIVCIEPIVLRRGLSGDDLAHAMILSPEPEQRLFDKRHEFDLIVYYDQSSKSPEVPTNRVEGNEAVLRDFSRAIFDYSFEDRQLKRRPMLLVGGLDAWIDLVGPQALATSKTSETSGQAPIVTPTKSAIGLMRGRPSARRLTYEARPLTREQESQWDATLKDEEVPSPSITRDVPAENWSYARTTEDFFRRYPDPSTQESMIVPHKMESNHSQSISKATHAIQKSHQDALNAMTPRPPTRPSPAVPRPSYSGISDKDGHPSTTAPSAPTSLPTEQGPPPVQTLGSDITVQGRTGLVNFSNTCYMNAVLQSLSATRFLSWFLMQGDFEKSTNKPRRKPDELTDPPQLMAKILANLMRHLWSGQFTHVTPKTFRNYVRDIHCRDRDPRDTFGGNYQQDAAEFLVFILQLLDDELNSNRHVPKDPEPSAGDMAKLVSMPPIYSAIAEWNRFFRFESSPINRLFGGQYTVSTTCERCKHCVKRWDTWIDLAIPILETRSQTLDDALKRHFAPEALDDYKCEGCGKTGGVIRTQLISRCPDYMIIDLKRATDHKIKTQITFPLDNLDMTPHFVSSAGSDLSKLKKEEYYGYIAPFKYKCYAVIQHEGQTIDSGHYWTLVRDIKENTWWEMNDNNVKETSAAKTQTANSYILFYKRV